MKFAKSTRIGSSGCIILLYARMEAHAAQMISDPRLMHVNTCITCRVSLAVQAQERCMRNNDRWCRRSEDPNLDSCSAYQRKATRLPERQYAWDLQPHHFWYTSLATRRAPMLSSHRNHAITFFDFSGTVSYQSPLAKTIDGCNLFSTQLADN